MQSCHSSIPSSVKTTLYLDAFKQHKGLVITFVLTLFIPLGGLAIGLLGDSLLIWPVIAATLFLVIPYFILSTLRSSIYHHYEIALVQRFGIGTTAIVTSKFLGDQAHLRNKSVQSNKGGSGLIEEPVYVVEYKYTCDKPYRANDTVNSKKLFDSIEINSQIPIKVLASAPAKSTLAINE